MTDYRPFEVRRSEGGDVVRATTGWRGALRYGPVDIPFDVVVGTTLTGIPWGYDATLTTVSVPSSVPHKGEMVLVRGGFGYPTTPLDGVAVWYSPDSGVLATDQLNQQVLDQPVTGGRWYYYTLFIKAVDPAHLTLPGTWLVGATINVLVPKNYGHADTLFNNIPPFYAALDDRQAADGRNGPLRKFSRIVGYDADYNRTLLDGVLNVYDPDLAPLMFTQLVGQNLGQPPEQALGGARYRSLVGRIWELEASRGTTQGLQEFIYAATNYRTIVHTGINELLSPDDAEFITDIGHWVTYANPHYVDMTDVVPAPDTHPPAGLDLSRVVLRKYSGVDLVAPSGFGQGVLEIIELTTTGGPGKYGQPGTIDGPQAPFQTLAQLRAAVPAVIPASVPGYYTAPNAFWAGDYVLLGDGSHAYWDGTQWLAGDAPNTGTSVRPILTGLMAGSPGSTLPAGALPPASFSNLPSPSATAIPLVAWKAGDYITLLDGTQMHAEWTKQGMYRNFGWATGPGVLTLPATIGQLGPITGYTTTWQVADGSFAVAPATLALLQGNTNTVVGRGQSADIYRPWRPTATQESYENLYTYANEKVSWIGWKRDNSSGTQQTGIQKGGPVTMDRLPSVSTTATAWADAGARAASAMTSSLLCYLQGQTGTTPAVPGWTKLQFPATGITMNGWTNPSGDRSTFRPTAVADARIHARVGSAGALPAGTALALFLNGAEDCRVTADGVSTGLDIIADITVAAGQDVDVRVYNPGATNIDMTITTSNYYWTPLLRIDPRPAYAANQSWVAPSGANGQRRHIVVGMAPNSGLPLNFYIMKNGRPIANGWMVNDSNTATYLETDTIVATGDVLSIGLGTWYYPAGGYMSVLSGRAPTLYNTRWETVP